MTSSRRLRRLHELRQIEERNQASLLQSATSELRRLSEARKDVRIREASGRALMMTIVQGEQMQDRVAGAVEAASASRISTVLARRIRDVTEDIARIRDRFVAKRIERRQAETLLSTAVELDALEAQRKSQLALDEWYRMLNREQMRDKAEDLRSPMSRHS